MRSNERQLRLPFSLHGGLHAGCCASHCAPKRCMTSSCITMNILPSIADLLLSSKVIAVVGLSPKPHRASHDVAKYLQANGYRIVPVNPSHAGRSILGEPCHATLADAAEALKDKQSQIDIVDCFRKSDDIDPITDEAISIKARCLWMQLGIVNNPASQRAQDAGLFVVMDRCLKTEHRKLARKPV